MIRTSSRASAEIENASSIFTAFRRSQESLLAILVDNAPLACW
jgi:hypothetical protein